MTHPPDPARAQLDDELRDALWVALTAGRDRADQRDAVGVTDCLRAAWMIEGLRRDLGSGAPDDEVSMRLRGFSKFATDRAWRGAEQVDTALASLAGRWRELLVQHRDDEGDG